MGRLPDNNSPLEDFYEFEDVNFIVSDIDGTLIEGEEPVLEQIKKSIKGLKQQKVQVTVATGRTYFGTKRILEELEIKVGMPVAFYNGGIVMEYGTENVLYSKFIEKECMHNLLGMLDFQTINMYIYTFEIKKDLLRCPKESLIVEKVYGLGPQYKIYDVNGLQINWISLEDELDFDANAILIEKRNMTKEMLYILKEHLEKCENVSYTDSGSGFVEIKASGLDKGIIFEIIRGQNNFSVRKFLAIGDNDNDVELFRYADIGVAVANSSLKAIQEADYICSNECAKGFLDMLNVVKQAKKYCRGKE